MDTTNIIFRWKAHFRGQVNKTKAGPRPNARGHGRGRKAGCWFVGGDDL